MKGEGGRRNGNKFLPVKIILYFCKTRMKEIISYFNKIFS